MKKRIRLDKEKVKNLVSKKLNKSGTFVNESKIDNAIKKYLIERGDSKDPESASDPEFSNEAINAFTSMSVALYDIVDDLKLIQTKESDVLVDLYPKEVYSETYLEEIIDNLELIIEAIEYLQDYDLGDFKDPQGR